MFGLITMLLTTLGATGMGSMLKIVGGLFAGISDAKEAKHKRELIRDMQLQKSDLEFQKAVFGDLDKDTSVFTRGTLARSRARYLHPSRKQRVGQAHLGIGYFPLRSRHYHRNYDRAHCFGLNRHSGSDNRILLYTWW